MPQFVARLPRPKAAAAPEKPGRGVSFPGASAYNKMIRLSEKGRSCRVPRPWVDLCPTPRDECSAMVLPLGDLHHTRMVIDEAVIPLTARFGPDAGAEIIAGADMTKAAFARAGEHLLAVSQAFAAAPSATWGVTSEPRMRIGRPVTPRSGLGAAPVQVGVLGVLRDGRDFAAFPPQAIGRVAA